MLALMGRIVSAGFTLAVLILAVVLAVSNNDSVAVSIWPFALPFELPLWLLVVGCFGSGLVLGGLAMLLPVARQQIAIIRLKKAIQNKKNREQS